MLLREGGGGCDLIKIKIKKIKIYIFCWGDYNIKEMKGNSKDDLKN